MSSAQSLHATSIAQLEVHAREFGRVKAWLRAVADLAGETAVETLHMPQAKLEDVAPMESVVRDLVDADCTLEAHLKALQELARDVQQESAKRSAAADQNERHAPAAANGKEGYEDAVAMDVDGDGGETPNEIDVEAMYMERLKRAIKATNATGKPSPTAKGKRRSGTPAEATADYKRHVFMKDFRADIRAFLPDTTDQADDDEDDDDMVVVAGGRETYICPLSRKLLEDPVTSTLCHHSYSRAAVEQMLRQRRLAQCPISGCNQPLSLRDLRPNRKLERAIIRHLYTQSQRDPAENDELEAGGSGNSHAQRNDDGDDDGYVTVPLKNSRKSKVIAED